jgi:membrane-associated protease RseP (regulator of RpoE activity)
MGWAPHVLPRRARFRHRWWLHILLFVLTLITTTLVGADRYAGFISDFGRSLSQFEGIDFQDLLVHGLWYSGTILLILGAHEMGHYLACRWYNIIGIAGPIAGFVLVVPAIFLGMYLSTMTTMPDAELIFIGKPLLFRLARWAVFGPIPDTAIVNLHPMVWAAWFGMLATALNLLPFGQLDGGHITYATLGRFSTPISYATVGSAIVMTFISLSWVLMTVLMIVMLLLFGARHPRVLDEAAPLGRGREALAVFALAMLILCFTPVPIQL